MGDGRLALLLVLGLAVTACSADEGLVGYWRFVEPGPRVPDLSGKGHVGSMVGARVVTEGEDTFLRLDGTGRVEIPSAPDLSLGRAFSLETRFRPADLSDGRGLVVKRDEFVLRLDWPVEGSQLSFFVRDEQGWEPRVSATKLPVGDWYHVVASWDGTQLMLWLNGLPYTQSRRCEPPAPTGNPLVIGAGDGLASGFVGDIEYVKLYARALTASEVIQATYGLSADQASGAEDVTVFDFRQGLHGWRGRQGAVATPAAGGVRVTSRTPGGVLLRDRLAVPLAQLDYVTLRMAVDRGSSADLIFITDRGASRVRFPIRADGRPHNYVLEAWQHVGWEGRLLALGVAPSDTVGAQARLESLALSAEPTGGGEVELLNLATDAALPRAERPERLVARFTNTAGPLTDLRLRLHVPDGVEVLSPDTQRVPALGYQQTGEATWTIRALRPLSGRCRVEAFGPGLTRTSLGAEVAFLPALHLPRADYVPEPVPAVSSRYEIWTHYCPLWKHGTHIGWKAIEPYPNRKPVLGWYNEGTPEVADWHIKMMLEHGITGVIYCWYRASINEPVKQNLGHALHDGLLKARYLDRIKFGIMWENGCGAGVGSAEDLMTHVFPYWLDHYFTHPSYLKIDGKPVLYIWVPGNVTQHLGGSEMVRRTFDQMRRRCRERGLKGLYIVGCMGAADETALRRMAQEGWDASSAYGAAMHYPEHPRVLGSLVTGDMTEFVRQQEAIWRGKARIGALPDITAAMMGWDARPWNSSNLFWSDNTAPKFRDLCLRAKAVMDAKSGDGPDRRHIIFCCWNEFGEGHYIEPTRGYGFSYLDVIREVFTDAPKQHTDIGPEDVGLGPYDSWYQQAKAAGAQADVSRLFSWTGDLLRTWNAFMGCEQAEVVDGALRLVTNSRDPALSSPPLKIRCREFSRVVVDMRVSSSGGAQLFWTTASYPRTQEAVSARAQTVADGHYHRVVFEVGDSEFWGGCLTGLRLDPTDQVGVTVEIRGITLE